MSDVRQETDALHKCQLHLSLRGTKSLVYNSTIQDEKRCFVPQHDRRDRKGTAALTLTTYT